MRGMSSEEAPPDVLSPWGGEEAAGRASVTACVMLLSAFAISQFSFSGVWTRSLPMSQFISLDEKVVTPSLLTQTSQKTDRYLSVSKSQNL